MSTASEQLHAKRIDLILQQLEQIPTLPAVAMRVLQVTADERASVDDVVRLISSDVSLTARILQLVHTADAGVRSEITTVDRAVVMLGFDAVRNAVLAVSIFETFDKPSGGACARFDRAEFWRHCIAVACVAELLAPAIAAHQPGAAKLVPSEAFVCGLLHDLGKIAFETILPKSFSRAIEAAELLHGDLAELERSVIGLDHQTVGKRLAEHWNLPAPIRDCIWLHGQATDSIPPSIANPTLVHLITLSDMLVRQQHLGFSGNFAFPADPVKLHAVLGLTHAQAKAALCPLVDRLSQRAAALRINIPAPQELFNQALSRANQELGQVNQQLIVKTRRLATRAKFFETLSDFEAELRADASPQTVLKVIGRAALTVLGVRIVAGFGRSIGSAIDLVLIDNAGKQVEEVATASDSRWAEAPDDGPIRAAGEEMAWLLSAAGPRLDGERRFWIRLQADGQCIGGIAWGAAAGEGHRLSPQLNELTALIAAWSLALRTAQLRDESRLLTEQLVATNARLLAVQAEAQQGRMMSSLGEMAAGAAHEMNNPLAVISGRSQLLAMQLTEPKLKAMAQQVFEQSHRISQIISELMDFARPVPPVPRACDVADVIGRALREWKERNDIAKRTIEVSLGDARGIVVDEGQVASALSEVIDNAIDATDVKTGRIIIRADRDPSAPPASGRVVVSVADNGVGMDELTLKRAFDPFFSSKPAGRRRGMGLAKALRWVQAGGGGMKLLSDPGHGTRVLLILPACDVSCMAPTLAKIGVATDRRLAKPAG